LGKKLSEIVLRLLLCERKISAREKNSQIEETDCQCGQKAGPYLIETKENTFLDLGKRIF
jgi:hypothetical protein